MKNILFLSLTLVLLLSLAGCGQPSVDQAKANFCQDLGEFGTAVAGLRQLDGTSTKQDLQDAVSDAEKAWGDLQKSAGTLKDVQVDGVQDAVSELQKSVNDIPDDATLAEGLADVRGGVVNTLAEIQQIASTTCSYPAPQ